MSPPAEAQAPPAVGDAPPPTPVAVGDWPAEDDFLLRESVEAGAALGAVAPRDPPLLQAVHPRGHHAPVEVARPRARSSSPPPTDSPTLAPTRPPASFAPPDLVPARAFPSCCRLPRAPPPLADCGLAPSPRALTPSFSPRSHPRALLYDASVARPAARRMDRLYIRDAKPRVAPLPVGPDFRSAYASR